MPAYQFAGVCIDGGVGVGVSATMEQQVVAHPASDETFLDAGDAVHGMVYVEQRLWIGVEVAADMRVYA